MSIFTVNRQQYDSSQQFLSPDETPNVGSFLGGTGLPFYTNQISQSRYKFNNVRNGIGGLYVPSNKLPTFQVSTTKQDIEIRLIKVSNDNDTPDSIGDLIPFDDNFFKQCYNIENLPGDYQTIISLDFDRNNILDCGQYYLQIGKLNGPDLFSEIFTVWDYDYIGVNVSGQIFGVTPPVAQVTLTFEFEFSNQINVTGGSIGGNPLTSNPELVQVPNFPLDIPQQIEVEITTEYSGTYRQMYELFIDSNDLQAGVQITKIYR